jgi:hypothetical protein
MSTMQAVPGERGVAAHEAGHASSNVEGLPAAQFDRDRPGRLIGSQLASDPDLRVLPASRWSRELTLSLVALPDHHVAREIDASRRALVA